MGTLVGVGSSLSRDPEQAGREAALNALKQAGVEKPDFVFLFATVGYDQRVLLRAVREATSKAPLSGCSGEGIITREHVDESNFSTAVMVISSDELTFKNACTKDIGGSPRCAGRRLAARIAPFVSDESIACFLLADGFFFHFEPFLATFEAALPGGRRLPLFGGLAADNWTTKRTYQYHDDEILSEGISCVIMSGTGDIAWGINHGCLPIGTTRTVTRSKGNIIYELDGVPVLKVLEPYFAEEWMSQWNKMTLNLCLGIKTPEKLKGRYEDYVIRYLVAKDDEEGYVTVQSDVAEGTELCIVCRDQELITSGMRSISRRINEKLKDAKPKFVLHFECMGRGKVVFREREKIEQFRTLQREVGAEVPWIGFYTYGEIGPVAGCNSFHNFTAVVTAIY